MMDSGMRDRLLGAWEGQVRENPVVARAFGCPSWLASEEWKGEKVEAFSAAFERVKLRYFPDGGANVPLIRPEIQDVPEKVEGISGTRGRPKKWGSEAERKAAYRKR
jgi:hypothetical protein